MPLSAPDTLTREFFEIRARILELAACLDRLERAEGTVENDPRLALLRRALTEVLGEEPGRAERVQLLFSRTYEPDWRTKLGV